MNRGIHHRYDITTDPSKGRVRRIVVSWLGLFLLALNLLVGSGFAVPAASETSYLGNLRSDRIVVCTASGMVVMDRDGHTVDPGNHAGQEGFCVFCLPLMHGNAHAPGISPIVLADRYPEGTGGFLPSQSFIPSPVQLISAALPRAPPLS